MFWRLDSTWFYNQRSIQSCQCALSAAVRRSGAPFVTLGSVKNRCRRVSSHSYQFGALKLVHSLCGRRFRDGFVVLRQSARAEVGTRVEELKELPGD